jgi:hypothetical protein
VPQLQLQVRSFGQLPATRHELRAELLRRGLDAHDVWTLELVVAELVGAAYDSEVQSPMLVRIETFARLHSVRLCGISNVDLRDAPFDLRERVLRGLTLAFGERRNADGTIDLWAEVPRSPQ